MAKSLGERGAGALLNESFAVAEKSEQLSSRFAFLGNLFEIPNWPSCRRLCSPSPYYSLYIYIDHIPGRFLSTLCVSARSIATVTTFCSFSSLTIVVTDIDGDGDTAEDGGGICSFSLLPYCARSSMVEKLLNVDLSRLEDGDMLIDAGQPDLKSARSFHAHLRTLASSSSSGGGRLSREWKRSTEHSCFPASATSPSTSLFVSSMSRFGTGYRTVLSIFTLPSILRTDRS
jgi:hypothetical protein